MNIYHYRCVGKNIAEGVSGLVVSPYNGYMESGASGLASGLAKGLLGVALKPGTYVYWCALL